MTSAYRAGGNCSGDVATYARFRISWRFAVRVRARSTRQAIEFAKLGER
jgi:hypothetical protein